jgi:hypothetical protein
MKPRVDLETSVISYLAARPSSDALNAARQFHSYNLHQAIDRFELYLSEVEFSAHRQCNSSQKN